MPPPASWAGRTWPSWYCSSSSEESHGSWGQCTLWTYHTSQKIHTLSISSIEIQGKKGVYHHKNLTKETQCKDTSLGANFCGCAVIAPVSKSWEICLPPSPCPELHIIPQRYILSLSAIYNESFHPFAACTLIWFKVSEKENVREWSKYRYSKRVLDCLSFRKGGGEKKQAVKIIHITMLIKPCLSISSLL